MLNITFPSFIRPKNSPFFPLEDKLTTSIEYFTSTVFYFKLSKDDM